VTVSLVVRYSISYTIFLIQFSPAPLAPLPLPPFPVSPPYPRPLFLSQDICMGVVDGTCPVGTIKLDSETVETTNWGQRIQLSGTSLSHLRTVSFKLPSKSQSDFLVATQTIVLVLDLT
jgi:hypothetical protein